MREAVAEFAALVNRARRFRCAMRTDPARKRKLAEKALHAGFIFAAVGIDLRVTAFKVAVRQRRRCTMAGTGHVDDVQVEFLDEAIQVHQQETLTGIRAPVPEQAPFDVFGLERFAQQRIGAQVNHAGREVVACAPVAVHLAQRFGIQHRGLGVDLGHRVTPWYGLPVQMRGQRFHFPSGV
jgi:hypothetical protein